MLDDFLFKYNLKQFIIVTLQLIVTHLAVFYK